MSYGDDWLSTREQEILQVSGAILAIILLIAAATFLLVGLSYTAGKMECKAKTADIGYEVEYGFWSGCMITLPDGRKIPLDSYYYQERP